MPTVSAPIADKRIKILDASIRKQHNRPDALIAILQKAQELFGYLEEPVLWHVARALKMPPSRVWGVATFYHLFRLKPQGEHTCVVCLGTACFVNGARKLVESVEKATNIEPGQTTKDGRVSLVTVRCLGACGIAPAVILDGQTIGRATPDVVSNRIREWMNGPR